MRIGRFKSIPQRVHFSGLARAGASKARYLLQFFVSPRAVPSWISGGAKLDVSERLQIGGDAVFLRLALAVDRDTEKLKDLRH
jgi:hypothetical protein